jgi:hypothetical protein
MSCVCGNCAAPLEEGASICARCGTPVPSPVSESYAPKFSTFNDLEGIGGWLILAAIGLGISPLRSIHGIYVSLHVLYGSQFQNWLSTHPGEAGLILFEAVTNTLFLITLVTLNFLFYRRKKEFPSLMIAFFALQSILSLVDHAIVLHYHSRSSPATLIGSILGAALWIPYYLRSQRVKATFVR